MAKVYVTSTESKANIKVCMVKIESWADLLFYETSSESSAKGDFLWYFVNNESHASIKIFWIDSESRADLRVFKVNSQTKAKWQKSSKLVGKLGK